VLVAVDLHLGPRVLAEEDPVTDLDVDGADLAALQGLAVSDGHDLALDRFLLRRVRDDDPALGLLFLGDALDDDAVLEGPDLGHGSVPSYRGLALVAMECQQRAGGT
jgi:hypothetical protein